MSDIPHSVIDAAGDSLAVWAIWTLRMRDIVRRSYAYIDGKVLLAEVVYHAPGGDEAMTYSLEQLSDMPKWAIRLLRELGGMKSDPMRDVAIEWSAEWQLQQWRDEWGAL